MTPFGAQNNEVSWHNWTKDSQDVACGVLMVFLETMIRDLIKSTDHLWCKMATVIESSLRPYYWSRIIPLPLHIQRLHYFYCFLSFLLSFLDNDWIHLLKRDPSSDSTVSMPLVALPLMKMVVDNVEDIKWLTLLAFWEICSLIPLRYYWTFTLWKWSTKR